MAFRKYEFAALMILEPKRASGEILAAYRVAGASLKGAATVLGCSERTLHRYVDELELRGELAKLTKQAVKAGWISKKRRPSKKKDAAHA